MRPLKMISRSASQTRKWGRQLGRLLRGGEIIGLRGDLGAGKTCFVRGVTEGLEVDEQAWVRSPSFTLINEYDGRVPIFHIDLYRIAGASELEELNLREYFFSHGVSLVEWFDHLPEGEVTEYLEIRLEHVSDKERRLAFVGHGKSYEALVGKLKIRRAASARN